MTARLLLLLLASALLAACGSTPRRSESPTQQPLQVGTPRANAANAVLFRAIALVGTPYRYGGNTPEGGFDCSGLVGYVFRDAAGVNLPRNSAKIGEIGKKKLKVDALQAGDLVFFAASRNISHVGIYVGERRFVHAPNSGGTVRLDSLDGPWWREHFVYGKRPLE